MSGIVVKATLRAIDFGDGQTAGHARFRCADGHEVGIDNLSEDQLRAIGPGYGVPGAFTITIEGPNA